MTAATWGQRLRALRLAAGLTQRELGRALDDAAPGAKGADIGPEVECMRDARAQHRVSRLERGVRLKSAREAARLAAALSELLGRPVELPPVDEQRGRSGPRGGDVQRRRLRYDLERGALVCPHCGEAL